MSQWEQLQDVWSKVHNKRVRAHFRDIINDPDNDDAWGNWEPDLNIPRHYLCTACLQRDTDTSDMVILKTLLFWMVLGEARAFQVPIYGIPTPSFQEARKFKPQVSLYFQEDHQDVEPTFAPVTAEVSFRLMNETSETITEAKARTIANRIRATFATGQGFLWQKGRYQVTYTDRDLGYALRVLCRSKSEGKRVVEAILDIQGHTPSWAKANYSENEDSSARYPAVPRTGRIYGANRRLPRARPVADVRFRHAVLHIHGMPNPIILVDRDGYYQTPALAT